MQKKKVFPSAQDTYNSIMELLSKIKSHIESFIKEPKGHPSVAPDLDRVAKLAETFMEQRPKSAKGFQEMSDSLDQEGVNLWNISGVITSSGELQTAQTQIGTGLGLIDDGVSFLLPVRLAAFRLVQAGLEAKPGVSALLNLLRMASKTGVALSEAGNNAVAGSVLTSAAKYEEMLRNAEDPEGTHRHDIASSTIVYFSSRMEAAWNEGNVTVAEIMSKKIAENEQHLALLTPQVREYLAVKFHAIGRSMLKESKAQAADAVGWLQRALALVDKANDETTGSLAKSKISILRTLALAYFTSESYDRAEAVLDELIPIVDSGQAQESQEYQQLRWLRLAVYKRRKARESALTEALKSIVDHMPWAESNITEVLQELGTLSQQHGAMSFKAGETNYADRFLLSLIFHCSKDDNHARAMNSLEDVFSLLSESDVELGNVVITACMTVCSFTLAMALRTSCNPFQLIWRFGGKLHQGKKWAAAADWYLLGSHQLFRRPSPEMSNKCYRKAALCYIELKEYAKASTVIRRCGSNEAATHYVTFLTAVYQGLENEAIRSINEMQKAPDFDRKMLLLATQVAHRSEMRLVLLSVLNHLLKTLKFGCSGEIVVEAMTLLRCMIKLILGLLVDPIANRTALINTMVEHFRTAKILAASALEQKAVSLIMKDLSWLWRRAYNSAVQGCSEWEGCGDQISELFEIAKLLLETQCQASPLVPDDESRMYLISATFAAVSGKVLSTREMITATGTLNPQILRTMNADIRKAKADIERAVQQEGPLRNADITSRGETYVHVLRIFEAEMCVQLSDWDEVSDIVKKVVKTGPLCVGTYEAIADMLWINKDCPVKVLQECLEVSITIPSKQMQHPPSSLAVPRAILVASLDQNTLSVERFSRWLRAICTTLITRDTPEGRLKAVGFCEQAIGVIEEHDSPQDSYPMDERHWLLGTAFNMAIECVHFLYSLFANSLAFFLFDLAGLLLTQTGSRLDEAKRWFEAALGTCRFVPGGKEQAAKISESYTNLLSRFEKAKETHLGAAMTLDSFMNSARMPNPVRFPMATHWSLPPNASACLPTGSERRLTCCPGFIILPCRSATDNCKYPRTTAVLGPSKRDRRFSRVYNPPAQLFFLGARARHPPASHVVGPPAQGAW
ncbi:meiosis protein SPO22/ZIP4 like-domain-containing protein [Ephemerocybe angulata]|uniref:Protein ZIP4 homolog n=1 Tax=Ephemerocybe angulata TaxID=980116 RepID=A0A8H6MB97_9AGAR|nr:meiosis protein SPO22/ZIP4 like-domain-containing protein [Tulosesus angulatus]